jgi:two-component system, chemotaxis family, chemotaxis protein CheY
MVVDDSDAIKMVLKDILKIGNHELVAEASNGIEAVQKYIETNPDIMLLDMAMPKMDGLSALKEIISKRPDAKVIMITASDNQNTIKECITSGAIAYILKPFNFQDVLNTIAEVLSS